ncbi:MAG TPA: hypothetical protein VLG37_00980 [Candidatus Saccharimonadales bacterium]|nr:hypothetical protein [Candidatus Saccharimonadales bacterium]
MSSEIRGPVTSPQAKAWARGEMPSDEFFAWAYDHERPLAEADIARRLAAAAKIREVAPNATDTRSLGQRVIDFFRAA